MTRFIWYRVSKRINYKLKWFFRVGNNGDYHTTEVASKSQAVKVQPVAVPSIPVDELKEVTGNFSTDSLIGEGSYGRVYYGVLKNGRAAAIKKLDASKQPDDEFLAQVCLKMCNKISALGIWHWGLNILLWNLQVSMVSRLRHENFMELIGYCVDGNQRVLAYEFASNGSLHDILHGILTTLAIARVLFFGLFNNFILEIVTCDIMIMF